MRIEGTWGLIHYETRAEGLVASQSKGDCNPFAPVGDDDLKLVILNTSGNDYLVTYYSWNRSNNEWRSSRKESWTIDGNQLFRGASDNPSQLSFSSDSFTMESSFETTLLGQRVYSYSKYVFKKMRE